MLSVVGQAVVAFFLICGNSFSQTKPANIVIGQVVDIVSGKPIGGARVTLRNNDFGSDNKWTTLSDEAGRFETKSRYITHSAYAERDGYKWISCSDFRKDCGEVSIVPSSGQKQEVIIRLTPLATLIARVVDERGKAADMVGLELIRVNAPSPVPWPTIQSLGTNGRGEFSRVVPPGEYIMRVLPRAPESNVKRRHVPFYYPAAQTRGQAVPFALRPGEVKAGLTIRLLAVRAVSIRGRIIKTAPVRDGQRVIVRAVPRPGGLSEDLLRISTDLHYQQETFELRSVPSGTYAVMVQLEEPRIYRAYPDVYAEGPMYRIIKTVQVASKDIGGLVFTITPGLTLKGRVSFDGNREKPPAGVHVSVIPVDPPPAQGSSADPGPDDSFSLKPLSPGRYRVLAGSSNAYYCKAVRLNGQSLPMQEFEVLPGSALGEPDILLSDRVGRIDARIIDREAKPVLTGVTVIVPVGIANEIRPYFTHRIYSQGSSGRIGMTPGDYKLFAFEGIADTNAVSRELLARFDSLGTLVHLNEGQSLMVELVAIKP